MFVVAAWLRDAVSGEVGVLKDGGKSEGAKYLAGVEVQHHNR